MSAVLGIDLGTSYFKVAAFSRGGRLLGSARMAVESGTGVEGRSELPAARFQGLLREAIGQALEHSDLQPAAVEAVSYSSQANSFLLLGPGAEPLSPIVLWNDRRVEVLPPAVERLYTRHDFLATTGLDLTSPLQFGCKLLWLREHDPELWRGSRMVMTISDYLTYLMTGQRAGDSGTAALTGLWDLKASRWWPEAMEDLGLDLPLFSRLAPPGTVVGRTGSEAERIFGLQRGTRFAVGGLDHHMAALGSGVGAAASVSESTGTVLACFAESPGFHPRVGCAMGPGVRGAEPFYLLAFHDSGASVLEWYRRRYAQSLTFEDLGRLAEGVPIGSQGLTCLPFADTLPGTEGFLGIGPEHGHGHFARAIMESVAAELGYLLERLCGGRPPRRVLSTGGGARSDLWLRIKADVTGCVMLTTGYPEPACAGAAMVAAAAAGWFPDSIATSTEWAAVRGVVEPDPSGRATYTEWLERYARARAPAHARP